MAAAACAAGRAARLEACAADAAPSPLFQIYIHAPPGYEEPPGAFPHGSPFAGRLLPRAARVAAAWGSAALVDAARTLLAAALADDARNLRFVLISESDVPLRNPLTFYADARCRTPPPEMGAVPAAAWRKSEMWWALPHAHAKLVAGDNEVYAAFKAHCRAGTDPATGKYLHSVSDEH